MPHVGRGMSTITTKSKQCASSRSMGNSSGTRCPPQSMWSSKVSHVRHPINHRPSIPLVPNHLHNAHRARCLPSEGFNLGDFEADDSNIGRDGLVAPHHRLEPRGAISSLPLSLFLPRGLLRAGREVGFLGTTWGHGCGGSLCAWTRGVMVPCYGQVFSFAPCGERHVHHNHVVGAVRLIGVDG